MLIELHNRITFANYTANALNQADLGHLSFRCAGGYFALFGFTDEGRSHGFFAIRCDRIRRDAV